MELRRDQMNRAIVEVKEIELSRALQLYTALCGALVQHQTPPAEGGPKFVTALRRGGLLGPPAADLAGGRPQAEGSGCGGGDTGHWTLEDRWAA